MAHTVKRGNVPPPPKFKGRCSHCGNIAIYENREIERDATLLRAGLGIPMRFYAKCPDCNGQVSCDYYTPTLLERIRMSMREIRSREDTPVKPDLPIPTQIPKTD